MKYSWALLLGLLTATANADTSLWRDLQAKAAEAEPPTPLQHYRLLALDETRLTEQLANPSVLPTTQAQARAALPTLSLPLPDGGFAEVSVQPNATLAPEITADFPDMQTWRVQGIDGKVSSGAIDLTPNGFHAMLDMANGDTVFIDPAPTGTSRQYFSFRKSANRAAFQQEGWTCAQHTASARPSFATTLTQGVAARSLAARAGETLHTYRLALATTAEYTQFYGSQDSAFASLVTLVNRINQVYERDLSVRLQLVSDRRLVYTNPATDPYSNRIPGLLLEENTNNLNRVLGFNGYDIGHVLATDGGGLASVGTVCGTYKAEGMTGLSRPTGEAFIIDYVAHEIGHQLGATHTFNGMLGACFGNNRERLTAYEPGSGTTIMAYTGLCNSDNVQSNSDSMMHIMSILQIQDYLHNGEGRACAATSSLGNRNPVANAGADYVIPAATPFVLTGSGSDPDGDSLSYSWEQINAGAAANVNVDLGDNALIRAHLPAASPQRTIPAVSDLINRTQSNGEVLPVTQRLLDFRLAVRDGKGGIAYDDTRLTVQNTGAAFAVTNPTTTTLVAGSPLTVTWNVAGTDAPPINCRTVDIAVSSDGGASFRDVLLNAPNNGAAVVTLPLNLSSRSHIRVKCSDNIFFALSVTNPAKARTSNGVDTSTTNTSSVAPLLSTGGGGGSVPLSLGLLLSYGWWRVRRYQGVRS